MNERTDSYESEEEVETTDTSDAEIQFDPSVLQNQTATYASLTDLHGIPLFTLPFQETMASVNERMERERQILEGLVFWGHLHRSDENEQLQDLLFQAQVTQIRIRDEEVIEDETFPHLYPLLGLSFLLFMIVLIHYVKKRRQKTEQMTADLYHQAS